MKAMIFAAGLGTRLKPITDTMPKALVPVDNHPLLELTIENLKQAGATEIVVNVHHFADQIINYVASKDWGIPVKISDESSQLLDTGGGLRHAAGLFTPSAEPVLIHNVDILSNAHLQDLYNYHVQEKADALLLVSERKTSRYLLFDDDMNLKGWTNINTGEIKSAYQNLEIEGLHPFAFSGIHTFSPTLFEKMEKYGDKFSIIDFYLNECQESHIKGFFQTDLNLLDVGKLDTLHEAEEWIKNHR